MIPRPDDPERDRPVGLSFRDGHSPRQAARVILRIGDDHALVGRRAFRHQRIGGLRLLDGETMRDQRCDPDLAFRNQFKERLHVPLFRPPHVPEGIVASMLFILAVIAARSIGH